MAVGGGGVAAGSVTGTANVGTSAATVANLVPGSGYTKPVVTFTGVGAGGLPVTGALVATVGTSAANVAGVVPGTGYTNPIVTFTGVGETGATVKGTGTALVGSSAATVAITNAGSGYTSPAVTFTGVGDSGTVVTDTTGSASVGASPATIGISSGGSGYANPTVTVSGGSLAAGFTLGSATATVDGSGAITAITLIPNAGFTSAPSIAVTDATGTGASWTVSIDPTAGTIIAITPPATAFRSKPTVAITEAGNASASATASLASTAGTITGITPPAILFRAAPTVAITDPTGTGASATASVSAPAGTIVAIAAPGPTALFIAAPGIAITDPTGTGASATASVASTAGTVTAVTLTPATALFTSPPSIKITDPTGANAAATASLAPTGTIIALTVTATGSGYASTPRVTISDATGGSGATAMAVLSAPMGVGAQATVTTALAKSIPVYTKAEQELFDAWGRYNSTGGIELPLTTGVIQTTVPLNYIDSATEILADNDVQIWKLVDNGFWSNSIHFDFADVQLINRVGWDGTVKAPASNELGWKDTLRLNPLEDVIVAMRAKRPSIPFGLPSSRRLLDPSKPENTTGAAASGLGFTVAAGVTPRLASSNVSADFDNEFVWNSAILGHSENDLTRPVVFHPTVSIPGAPSNLMDVLGNGALTWIDPTPAGGTDAFGVATLANRQNEVGFKVLKSSLDANGNAAAYAEVARVPANTTRWTDPAVSNLAAYQVVAYNAAGDSAPSNGLTEQLPIAPTTFDAMAAAFNSVTLTWNGASTTNQLQVWRGVAGGVPPTVATAVAPVVIATLPGTATGFVDNAASAALYNYTPAPAALMSYTYQIKAVNAFLPLAAGAAVSAMRAVQTPMEFVAAPTLLTATVNAAGTSVVLRWTDNATNETAYWIEVSTDGGATFPTPPTAIARTPAQKTAIGIVTANVTTVPGSLFAFRVTAVNVTGPATSTSSPLTSPRVDLTPPLALAVPTGLAATVNATTAAARLTWTAVTGASGYLVSINGATAVLVTGATNYTPVPALAIGSSYSVTVASRATRYGLSTASAPSAAIAVDLTAAAAPVAPATLTATATRLAWAAATGVSTNATVTYAIQGSKDGGATWAPIAGSPFAANASPLVFASPAGTNYVYQVQALATRYGLATAASGWTTSPVFNTLPAASTTPVAAAGAAGSRQITVTWTNVSANITGFTVQRRLGGGAWNIIVPTVTQAVPTNYSLTDTVPAAGSYTYRLSTASVVGSTANTAASNAVIAP